MDYLPLEKVIIFLMKFKALFFQGTRCQHPFLFKVNSLWATMWGPWI